MAWSKIIFNELYYRVGLNGTEYRLDGTKLPPIRGNAESELQAHAGTNYDYIYSGTYDQYHPYDDPSSLRFLDIATIGSGNGINWINVYANMPDNEIVYIYRTKGDPSVSFAMRKETARVGFNCGSYYYGTLTIDNTCVFFIRNVPSSGVYPQSIQTSSENLGFLFSGTRYTIYYSLAFSQYEQNYYNIFFEATSNNISNVLVFLLTGNTPPPPSDDPYAPGGTSESGGGEGSFDDVSDAVTMPGIPGLNLSINGFVTAYAPTLTQINDLATFIWSDWLSGGPTLPKIFANPEDAIISLHMLPFEPSTSSAIEVTVGHYASGVQMDPMTNQFYTINCGSLTIEEYWGNYLDYNPYTKLTLFLPYVGEITLNPDEVMTRTLTIKYRVDAMTGAFVCFILRDDDKILGEYQGNCSLQVPISSANYAQLHSALLGLAGSAVGIAAGAAGSGISGLLSGGTNVLTSAAGMMDSKIRHSHSGALGSASGFMGSQSPYLIIERARQCLPDGLNRFAGYPSQITETLGDLRGFTSVSEIVLDGIPLTDEELAELREILKGGVYL